MEIISERIIDIVIESVIHAGVETIKTLPFLFAAFMIMELMERHKVQIKPRGYFVGAMAGCIPQCSFAAATANLWTRGHISTGTLIAVFVSTSDEALLLLMSSSDHTGEVVYILFMKIMMAITAGYTVDHIAAKRGIAINGSMLQEHYYQQPCNAGTTSAVIAAASSHAFKLSAIIFIFSAVVNIIIHMAGDEVLSAILMRGTILQPVIAAAVGLIPSCMPSLLMTQLYMEELLSFPALLAGLTANAGIGLLITKSAPIAIILFTVAMAAAAVSKILIWAI